MLSFYGVRLRAATFAAARGTIRNATLIPGESKDRGQRSAEAQLQDWRRSAEARCHPLDNKKSSPAPKQRSVVDGNSHAGVDRVRIEKAVREILFSIGEDPDREGLRET